MHRNLFLALLTLIATFGLLLRLPGYAQTPPFAETMDEFMYPFAGLSLLTIGEPVSWSPFSAYRRGYEDTFWGIKLRIVSPWLEKPPLYPLITGAISLLSGQSEFHQVRLSTIRLIPVGLNFFTILFLGLLTANSVGKIPALIAAGIYATTPIIVLGNRLSLTENLLTPIALATLWIFTIKPHHLKPNTYHLLLGIGCALAILTKQIGLVLPLSIITLLILSPNNQQSTINNSFPNDLKPKTYPPKADQSWAGNLTPKTYNLKPILIVFVFSIASALILPLMGWYYDWNLFVRVTREFSRAHTLGLPETIFTLFRFPGIGHKEAIFLDGTMLAGFILLLTSPFWLKSLTNNNHSSSKNLQPTTYNLQLLSNNLKPTTYNLLLIFPFIYITLLALLEGGTTWFGWHLFPLYPFVAIVLAIAFYQLYLKPQLFQLIFFYIILGASSLRFILLLLPQYETRWPGILTGGIIAILGVWFMNRGKYQHQLLLGLFVIYILVNLTVVTNLPHIYPTRIQPY